MPPSKVGGCHRRPILLGGYYERTSEEEPSLVGLGPDRTRSHSRHRPRNLGNFLGFPSQERQSRSGQRRGGSRDPDLRDRDPGRADAQERSQAIRRLRRQGRRRRAGARHRRSERQPPRWQLRDSQRGHRIRCRPERRRGHGSRHEEGLAFRPQERALGHHRRQGDRQEVVHLRKRYRLEENRRRQGCNPHPSLPGYRRGRAHFGPSLAIRDFGFDRRIHGKSAPGQEVTTTLLRPNPFLFYFHLGGDETDRGFLFWYLYLTKWLK